MNAVDKVNGRTYTFPDARLDHPSVQIAPGKLVSVCSMNMQFRREILPAAYQLPMHVEILPDGVIDRYGDIWGGFIMKTLMDIRGDALVVGEPMIEHLKEGNCVRNIWQENLCHQVNDEFLALLTDLKGEIAAASYLEMMEQLAELFHGRAQLSSPLLRSYLDHLAPAMLAWLSALSRTGK